MHRRGRSGRWDPLAVTLLDQAERWRSLAAPLAGIAYRATDQQAVIDADVSRWADKLKMEDDDRALARLVYAFAEFRTVFYRRLRSGNPAGDLLGRVLKLIWRPVPGLDLVNGDIGPGLFVSHGHGTVLDAQRIGTNCHVHHGVTIGWDYRGSRRPILGDDVFIGAGAKILGAVTVGDGARIGANAVVTRDVPAGATAVGMPARILNPATAEVETLGPPAVHRDGVTAGGVPRLTVPGRPPLDEVQTRG